MKAVTAMVQKAMQYIDDTPDIETHIELIKTLNNVSTGKVNDVHMLEPEPATANLLYVYDSYTQKLFSEHSYRYMLKWSGHV